MKFKPSLAVYFFAGVGFFLFWLLVVFPYGALKSRVITEIENRSGGRFKISASDMDLSIFGSMTFKNFKMMERGDNQEILWLESPRVKVSFSPFQLITKKNSFSFSVKAKKKGSLEGDYRQEKEFMELNLDFSNFPLGDFAFLANKVPLQGNLDGDFGVKVYRVDAKSNRGSTELKLANIVLNPMKINLDPEDPSTNLDLPKITLSGAKGSLIKGEVKTDKYELGTVKLTGGDLDLDLKGRLTLRGRSFADYRLSLQGNMKISDKLIKDVPYLQLLEAQKNPQGLYPVNINGRLAKPNIEIGKFHVPM